MARRASAPRGSGRPRDDALTRAILAAMLDLVARHGFRDARIEDAAVRVGAADVAVPEGVAGPVHPGRLAVPDTEHAVVLLAGEGGAHLAAEHCGGTEFLVEAGHVHEVPRIEDLLVRNDLAVETTERRALVTGDECGGLQTVLAVGTHLIDRHADERLYTGEEEAAVPLAVLRVEVGRRLRTSVLDDVGHCSPSCLMAERPMLPCSDDTACAR